MPSRADYERFFREADKDNSGSLSSDELVAKLRQQGYSGTDENIKNMFRSADVSGDNLVSLEEYLEAMGEIPPSVHGGAAARKCFREFDKNGDGTITKEELAQVFREMGKVFPANELNRMMELCDADGSGSIDYEEFVKKIFGGKG